MNAQTTIGDLIYTFSTTTEEINTATVVGLAPTFSGNSLTIPGTVSSGSIYYNVTAIADTAFLNNKNITTVALPSMLMTIGDSAFYGSPIDSVALPSALTSIGDSAFAHCLNLKVLTFAEKFDPSVFFNASKAKRYVQENNKDSADYGKITQDEDGDYFPRVVTGGIGSTITTIYLPTMFGGSSEHTIPKGMFSHFESLETVNFDANSSFTTVGAEAFAHTFNLKGITLPESMTTLEDSAFYDCDLESIDLSNTQITSVGESAFADCSLLEKVVMPSPSEGLTLDDNVFQDCSSLTYVDLGSNLTTLGEYAFDIDTEETTPDKLDIYVSNSDFVELKDEDETNHQLAFCDDDNENDAVNSRLQKTAVLHVPYSLIASYHAGAGWKDLDVEFTIGADNTTVPSTGRWYLSVKRNFTAGRWATLALPAAIPLSNFQSAFGDDVQVYQYTGDEKLSTGGYYLHFSALSGTNPYTSTVFVRGVDATKATSTVDETSVYLIGRVQMGNDYGTEVSNVTYNPSTEGYNLVGTFVKDDDGLQPYDYFINANKFYRWTGSTTSTNAMTGVFRAINSANAAKMYIVFDDFATSIDSVTQDVNDSTAPSYNLSGQRVDASYKGIVIRNGRKYVQQ
ncbi:MAG: leucine-rich repeat domain-containing protein [Prevotella sp.]